MYNPLMHRHVFSFLKLNSGRETSSCAVLSLFNRTPKNDEPIIHIQNEFSLLIRYRTISLQTNLDGYLAMSCVYITLQKL